MDSSVTINRNSQVAVENYDHVYVNSRPVDIAGIAAEPLASHVTLPSSLPLAPALAPSPTSAFAPSNAPLTVDITRSIDDLFQALMMRGLSFMGEQSSPYGEEYDGNDFCCTHVLAKVGKEPVGALRIRWFAEWCKIERLSVRAEFRGRRTDGTRVADALAAFAVNHLRRKGYTLLHGHAQERLVPFWSRHGYHPIGGPETHLVYGDHRYIPIAARFEPHPEAIGPDVDPMVMVRPEGRWDAPGPFDHSMERPATCPHRDGHRSAVAP